MNKLLVVPINLFTLEQQILICDDSNTIEFARVELAKIPEVLADLAYAKNINNIKLIGNKSYATALKDEINKYAINNYTEKNQLNISILEG